MIILSKKNNVYRVGNILSLIYPLIVAILFFYVDWTFKFSYSIKGYENILESIITFASIIIGFYTAMYGILLTLSNSSIIKEFRKRDLDNIFKIQLYDSLSASFVILIISILMQIAHNYPGNFTNLLFDIWFTCLGYFLATSYRAISLLLRILFVKERPSPKMKEKNSLDKQRQIKEINDNNKKING